MFTHTQPDFRPHGGRDAPRKAKTLRPFRAKQPMHLVFRASRARGAWSFLRKRNREGIEALLERCAKRFSVRVLGEANVGNHIHLLVQARRKSDLQNFLRVFAQGVVFLVTGARKGRPVGKFWDALVFSRVVRWGREYSTMLRYIDKNRWESAGMPRSRVDAWFRFFAGLRRGAKPWDSFAIST